MTDHTKFYQFQDDTKRLDNRRLIVRIDGSYILIRVTDEDETSAIPAAPIFKSKKEALKYMNDNQYIQLE